LFPWTCVWLLALPYRVCLPVSSLLCSELMYTLQIHI
jgi:hypothetical protein